MKKIVIVDYQVGNIFSILNACEKIGIAAVLSANPADIRNADGLILPGVGAFENAMVALREQQLIEPIIDFAKSGKPLMGICLGMQLLFDCSYEFGKHQGLGLIPGIVEKFPSEVNGALVKVPHIGWNKIYPAKEIAWKNSPFSEISNEGDYVYFIHSYHVVPKSPESIIATTDYSGIKFCSSVRVNNLFATQFHPEKSGEIGISILRNWLTQVTL